ncbi:hypothetical protein GmHk_06G014880 [Glycine max]|nr:hypothetical protein GmHk_06G014880 [Glycine max]
MITRSNLVEQLREYQIRSKHDWASVSFFSSTSSNITTSRSRRRLGGCGGFCNMGTCYFSFLGLFRSLFVLQAHPACFYFSLHHNPIAFMHENYKASKACKEKETKDASSIVNVKWHQVLTFGIFPILLPFIYWLGSWPFVTISTGLAYHSSLDCVSSDSTHSKSTEVYN